MPSLFNRYATPFITGLFLVSLVSGIALFFHIGPRGFHGMHEWLSMVLILPLGLHVWKNRRAFTVYFRHAPMAVALVVSAVAAAVFLMPSSQPAGAGGGNPALAVLNRLTAATPAELAGVLDTTPEAVTTALATQGIAATAPDQPLTAAFAASGKSAMQVAQALNAIGN